MKTKLHKAYYVLAFIDIVTIAITLLLAYSIYQTYEKSYRVNEQWMQRSAKYDELTDLAILANGPGNNVFHNLDVKSEKKHLIRLNQKINTLTTYLQGDAKEHLHQYPEINQRLHQFTSNLDEANRLTERIFSHIKKNQIREAGEIMATMDAQFHQALLEISKLRKKVRSIQTEHLSFYHQNATAIFYKEFYIAGFILLLVGFMVYFGRKIKTSFEELLTDLELQNNNLADSEQKLKTVLNTILESVILINDRGLIEYMNPKAESIFQYSFAELAGQNVKVLMPNPYHDEHDGYISNYMHTGKAKIIGTTREVSGLKKDGTVFPIEIGVSEVRLKNRVIFAGVLKDITEKKKADFYRSNISKIQDMYINGADQRIIFDTILKFLLEYTGSEYGFIGAIFKDEHQTPYLKTYAITNIAWNDETRAFYDKHAPEGMEFRNLDTLFGHTVKTGEVVISNSPKTDPRAGGLPKGHPDMHCYLGMPVKGNEGLIAMYGLANRKGGYDEVLVEELNLITAVMTSIIEATRNMSLIEKMANRDALTGAYNRFYFKSYINEMLRQRTARNESQKFCIMMIDFNRFKHINDFYGHEYGDHVLKEFVNRVQEHIKGRDLLARLGGDEFVVLLDDIHEFGDAGKVAERIVNLSKIPYVYRDKKLQCSVSIGIACFPISGGTIDELLRHADLALYRVKSSEVGYGYFSEDLQIKYLEQRNLEREITQAFDKRQFYLVFQPKVDLTSGAVIGCEALLRWRHPFYGTHSPLQFIGAIESMGLSEQLNTYVAEETVRIFSGINPGHPISVSINISPHTYKIEESIQKIAQILKNDALDKRIAFELEITETGFMTGAIDFRKNSPIDSLLSEHGIGLALDDFGIKYSSINRLFECNFSAIKIDSSFVQKLDTQEAKSAHVVIEAIMHIARGLDIEVIAEGVETEVQVTALKALGCRTAQGYYFYKPMAAEEFITLVQA